MLRKSFLVLMLSALICVGQIQAAEITWLDPIPMDVPIVVGDVVEAINLGGPEVLDVGGVDFAAGDAAADAPQHSNISDLLTSIFAGTLAADIVEDPGLKTVVASGRWISGGAGGSLDMQLTNLTPGTTYAIQLYTGDQRDCCMTRGYHFEDGTGGVSPVQTRGGGMALIGQFTADSDIQTMTMVTESDSSDPHLTGYVLSVASAPTLATNPSPAIDANDVLRDSDLSWTPSQFAGTHNLYFGDDLDAMAMGLDVNSFELERLEFGKTYSWRVDEVNATPDRTVFEGEVWSFEVEPYSIQIPGAEITATASSYSNEFSLPDKTIDGSGLAEDGTHGIATEAMWFTEMGDATPWIQYEFEGIKQLDVAKIWNSNSSAEGFIGYGVNGVLIETSTDGQNWEALEGVTELSRAPGLSSYDQYDEIAFGGVAAKMVRLNIQSNFGGFLESYSLSEVQLYAVPAAARTPMPESEATGVLPNQTISWRAGRAAAQSTVYVSTDANEVADGLAPSATSNTNSISLTAFDIQMGETYYWRVDEVNNAEAVPVWAGPVWSFSTVAAMVVDDFESYGNDSPDRPFQTWLDGIGYSPDEYFPVEYSGNGTGAAIGHDIWSGASEHYNGDIMETVNTMSADSGQSMPLYYDNAGVASQTERSFSPAQDWTVGGAQTLSIAFSGQEGNTGTLYVKINNTKLTYPRAATNIAIGAWQAWNIDLTSMNVQNVTTLQIGIDGSSASGLILIDDIRLHPEAGEVITPADPGTDGLVASYSFEGNANDVSGNGNNGTVNGGVMFAQGKVGQAIDCDGLDGYVSTGKVASDLGIGGNNARTISSWVYTRSYNNGGIYDVGARVAGEDFCLRTMDTDSTWRIQYWGGDSDFTLNATDKWVHFTHVHDGVNTKIYANGLLIVDWEKTIDTTDTNPFQIGLYGWPGNYFDGLIDEVRVYNRALSAEEALSLAGITSPVDKPF